MLRRLLKILGFLILAFIVVIAGFLGNAHWQVRQVQTPLPTIGDIRAMLSPVDGPKSISVINTGTQNVPGKGVLAYPAFVLQWADNTILMIDVGMAPDGAIKFGQLIESIADADPVTPHGSVSDQLGEATADVAGVMFTHLHEDHTSGLHALYDGDGKEIPLFQISQQTDMENFSTAIGNIAIEEAGCIRRSRLQGDGPLYPVPGFPGLLAFPAGGHTPGSTVNVLVSHDLVALQDSQIPIMKGANSK